MQERMLGVNFVSRIVLNGTSSDILPQVEKDVTNLLRTRHGILPGRENDFTIQNSKEILAAIEANTRTLTLFLGSIAAISFSRRHRHYEYHARFRHRKNKRNRHTKSHRGDLWDDYHTIFN